MRPLLWLASILVLIGAMAACAGTPPPTPVKTAIASLAATPSAAAAVATTAGPSLAFSGFTVGFDTGSVPPPFNYAYTLDGTFSPNGLSVHYVLTYQFRDQITTAEITREGYTANDDIDWSSTLTGQSLATWQNLVAQTTLGPIPPLVPGTESFSATLTPKKGEPQVGVPENRDAWQVAITALDRQARTETGATRKTP